MAAIHVTAGGRGDSRIQPTPGSRVHGLYDYKLFNWDNAITNDPQTEFQSMRICLGFVLGIFIHCVTGTSVKMCQIKMIIKNHM